MNKKLFIVVGAVVVIIGTSVFFSFNIFQSTFQNKPVKITMNKWPGYAHSYIAQEQGFFVNI